MEDWPHHLIFPPKADLSKKWDLPGPNQAVGWRLIVDPPGDPAANMAADEDLACRVRERRAPSTLRIYRWNQPAISIGRRQQVDDLPSDLLRKNLPIVQRPTGGGAVLHRLDELTYALALSYPYGGRLVKLHEIPQLFHGFFRRALIQKGFISSEVLSMHEGDCAGPPVLCFSAPVCGDLLYHGRKVAGSALRAWREGILLQGSLQDFPVSEEQVVQALQFVAVAGITG